VRFQYQVQRIERLSFDYGEESQPADNVENICENMLWYPPELCLTGDDLLFDYDPELIADCVAQLTPEKVCVFVSSKELAEECNATETWFGAK
jgi:nardilysin